MQPAKKLETGFELQHDLSIALDGHAGRELSNPSGHPSKSVLLRFAIAAANLQIRTQGIRCGKPHPGPDPALPRRFIGGRHSFCIDNGVGLIS